MAGKLMLLRPSELRIDGGTQCRVKINADTVEEYSAAINSGAQLPPLEVINDGKYNWVWDGLHRYHGHVKAKIDKIPCNVACGTCDDARWLATGANQTHGMRRTNADKVEAVKMALEHPKAVDLSDHDIAKHVGVDHKMVGKYRKQLNPTSLSSQEVGDRPQSATENTTSESSEIPPWDDAYETPPASTAVAVDPLAGLCKAARDARDSGKIVAPDSVWVQLAGMDPEDEQPPIIASVLKGRETLPEAVGNGEAKPLDPQERSDLESQKIQNAVGRVSRLFREEMANLTGPWLKQHSRQDWGAQAESSFKAAMTYLKAAKPDRICRKCGGAGCNKCQNSGLITTYSYQSDLDLSPELRDPIDQHLSEVWEKRKDFKAAMQAITQLKRKVHALMETEAGGYIDGQQFDLLLTNARSILKFAAPCCECAKCRRDIKKTCPACKGTGWVHRSMHNSAFSDADKAWLAANNKQPREIEDEEES